MIQCTGCLETKPETDYHSGNRWQCKDCVRAKQRLYHHKNKQSIKPKQQARRLRRCYGLSPEDYERLIEGQGHCCAICRATDPCHRWGRWCVDHCHETGKVRGLLCDPCNKALGVFGDNLEGITRVVNYLQSQRESPRG